MKFRSGKLVLSLLILVSSANNVINQTLDHQVFLRKIENSSDNIYRECIQKYDDYLADNPGDVAVIIEKCKFIQLAQYNAEEEYNPNQEEFDSCAAELVRRFPYHPDVLIFQTTYLWGEELESVFIQADSAILVNPEQWDRSKKGLLYMAISDHHYWDEKYDLALQYCEKAQKEDSVYKFSFEFARILQKLNRNEEAIKILLSENDTSKALWTLRQKADMLLDLKAFAEALDFYARLDAMDSTYIDRASLASTLEGVGQYVKAREYLVRDTSETWDKESSCRRLFLHDLKFQDGSKCIDSYNSFRNEGFSTDPLGMYRLKLLYAHPFLPWKLRDIPAILCLMLVIIILIILPSIWILPVYAIGHKWRFAEREKKYLPQWNLKVFWLISTGYLLASVFSMFCDPEWLYSKLGSYYYEAEQSITGTSDLIFMIIFGLFGFAALIGRRPSILAGVNWDLPRNIFLPIVFLVAFKVVSAVYISIGAKMGISVDEFACIPEFLLSSRKDVEALFATHGKAISILFICLLVPVYEEIIFRGVILDSCHRHLSFRLANAVQSSLFAAVHMSLFLFPVYFLFGFITGILRKKSNGLLPGIIFHIVNNFMAISYILAKTSF